MDKTGKQLEGLVSFIEKLHLPDGFEVKTNERVLHEDGIQVAEFDIEVRGKLGTTDIVWLIECRDRPSQGPAPASWIEQLVGRRTRFKFNRVTAVSTTGFAQDGKKFALQEGIELREVKALTPEHFGDWLLFQSFPMVQQMHHLAQASLIIDASESEPRRAAFRRAIEGRGSDQTILRSTETDKLVSPLAVFATVVAQNPSLFKGVMPDQPGTKSTIRVRYPNDLSHFVVDTPVGSIRIREILFQGELSVKCTPIPLARTVEYGHVLSGEPISQTAAFDFAAFDTKISLEMHKLAETGETHIVLRKLGKLGS